ncbi:MAG: anion transporter, partial [Planctomycetes bacterium]|nr:anion transporter [Planctomycetota bacterium]
VVQLVIVASVRGRWTRAATPPERAEPRFDAFTTGKALLCALFLVVAFLATDWPREVLALGVAGVLLLSRRTHSRAILAEVDGPLLVLFMGLFVVNHALAATGRPAELVEALQSHGVDLRTPAQLFLWCVPLSNVVSNVPAVMLLLPQATHPSAGSVLALASTLAGNLVLVGSIANLIVVDQAARAGVRVGWREHARVGVPITLLTLAIAALWLWLRSAA